MRCGVCAKPPLVNRFARFVVLRFRQRKLVLARRLLHEERRLEAERLGHILHFGQIGQVVQSEPNQEFPRRGVEERPADHLLAANDLDQMPFEQGVGHRRC